MLISIIKKLVIGSYTGVLSAKVIDALDGCYQNGVVGEIESVVSVNDQQYPIGVYRGENDTVTIVVTDPGTNQRLTDYVVNAACSEDRFHTAATAAVAYAAHKQTGKRKYKWVGDTLGESLQQ